MQVKQSNYIVRTNIKSWVVKKKLFTIAVFYNCDFFISQLWNNCLFDYFKLSHIKVETGFHRKQGTLYY